MSELKPALSIHWENGVNPVLIYSKYENHPAYRKPIEVQSRILDLHDPELRQLFESLLQPTPTLTLARDALVDAERLLREVAEAEVVRLVRGGLFTPEEASENAKPMFDKLDGYKKIISAINAEMKE